MVILLTILCLISIGIAFGYRRLLEQEEDELRYWKNEYYLASKRVMEIIQHAENDVKIKKQINENCQKG